MVEKQISVKKTARYYLSGEISPAIKNVWFVCHGYAELAKYFIKKFDGLNDGATLVVAPEALNKFYSQGFSGRVGASWMTKDDRINDIKDYVAYLNDVYTEVISSLSPNNLHITAFGFSQGTATIGRWVAEGKSPVNQLILWAGNFPHDVDLGIHKNTIEAVKPILVIGDQDPYMTEDSLQKNTDRFDEHQIPLKIVNYQGAHRIDTDVLKNIAQNL